MSKQVYSFNLSAADYRMSQNMLIQSGYDPANEDPANAKLHVYPYGAPQLRGVTVSSDDLTHLKATMLYLKVVGGLNVSPQVRSSEGQVFNIDL